MENLFVNTTIKHTINLDPKDINNQIENTILKKVKSDLEGICIKSGYVKKGSINIIARSLGQVATSHFNGTVMYNLTLSANICNPLEGNIISAKIININKMGVLANAGDSENNCLTILLAKQHHLNNEQFDKLQVDDTILVEVIGKRFEYGDDQISIIAVLNNYKKSKPEKDSQESNNSSEVVLSGVSGDSKKQSKIYYNNKDYKWLSRGHLAKPFTFNDRLYNTVEHAFQAQKVDINNGDEKNLEYQDLFTADSNTYIGNKASDILSKGSDKNIKSMGLKLRDNWDDLKLEIMRSIMKEYYESNSSLKEKLVNTGVNILINKGGKLDKCWGVDRNGDGENNHGKILMELRNTFKQIGMKNQFV